MKGPAQNSPESGMLTNSAVSSPALSPPSRELSHQDDPEPAAWAGTGPSRSAKNSWDLAGLPVGTRLSHLGFGQGKAQVCSRAVVSSHYLVVRLFEDCQQHRSSFPKSEVSGKDLSLASQ